MNFNTVTVVFSEKIWYFEIKIGVYPRGGIFNGKQYYRKGIF